MSPFRTIEIDFDLHKLIEAERQGFYDTPNDVLRRKLGLPDAKPDQDPLERLGHEAHAAAEAKKGSWVGKGVMLPEGTQLRMQYNGHQHAGEIKEGEWFVGGQRFSSPSAAAGGAAKTKAGTKPSLDGWIYWEVKRPGDAEWLPIKTLRRKDPYQ